MQHGAQSETANPSENHPDFPSSPQYTNRSVFQVQWCVLQITDVHWFLLFSTCSVLSTRLDAVKGLIGDCWKGRDAVLSRQSRQLIKLVYLNYKHGDTISVGH